ncbi:hypothetical protein LCGC14_0428130 [marine sediment metagenome]|uniref:Uncharacterized protein n=1 Tax=marine sediment metagenome TaxID=412755 RepID=A0A0F9VY58_9ZZZZ
MDNNPKHEKGYSPSRVIGKANDDGTVPFVLTERKVDRDGDVVESGGGRLDNFKANPIVLFAHGMSRQQSMIPVGRVGPETMKQTQRRITGDVGFHDSGSDPFSAMIGDKVRGGFLNAGSIGFMPIVVSTDTVLPHQTGITYTEWELLEFSIVPIPSLASATARREFEAFAGKCADYGQPLGDGLLKIVNRHMDLHGGILKALGEAGYEQESRPVVAERDVLDVLDKLQADMHLVKSVLQHKPAETDIETQSHLLSPDHIIRNGQQPTYDIEMISLQLALAEQDLVQAHR